jgi:hypothetical protein
VTIQTKVFTVSADTVRRNKDDGTGGQGCGQSKHIYVGRSGASGSARNYDYFAKFTLDWTGVARIVSAVLNVYTDEYNTLGPALEVGLMGPPSTGEVPKALIYRLTSAFTVGNNVDGNFNASDYTAPSHTTSNGTLFNLTPGGADLVHHHDITGIVRSWAPASVQGGGKVTNHGIGLFGTNATSENFSGWSNKHTGGGGVTERPTITLTYELGPTIPNTPSAMTPSGAVPTLSTFSGTFSDVRTTDTLQSTDIEVYDGTAGTASSATNKVTSTKHGLKNLDPIYFVSLTGGTGLSTLTLYYVRNATTNDFQLSTTPTGTIVNITVSYSALIWGRRVVNIVGYVATNSDRVAATFNVPKPTGWTPSTAMTYRWRARYKDQEAQVSAWSGLVSFNLTDTAPNPPQLSPIDGSSYSSLNLVKFQGGTFSDPNVGDYLMAHQVQLSPFPQGDARWNEADGILWDTGKAYEAFGATNWTELYGGRALTAGTYYWRAQQWDQRDGVSNWTYASIILTADFNPDPASYSAVQIDPKAPWRIIIRDIFLPDGVTKTVGRAPGNIVAIFEEAKNVGASIVYNSPGELHFTLLKDDEQISVVEPKQTHYAVEFYSGDGWQEKFAGVIWDVDATETDVVFKGIDYLGMYDTIIDERYDPLKPNKSYKSNGSFYEAVTIRTVVMDQLNWAKKLADSWVGHISIGLVEPMNEKVSVYSTMQPTLSFVAGLIDSHRQGTGKRTRMKVVKTTTGTYQLQIKDDPGVIRSDLAMYYGELVQGYRVIFFGDGWANVEHVIGRNRDGVKVVYQTIKGKPFQPATSLYGRIATVAVMDGVQDQNDLARRGLQAAIQSAKLGKNVAIGIRTEFLAPLQGWDVCDVFPLKILDGAVDTDAFGSGFWAAYAAAWEATDVGEQSLVITFMPREDASAPDVSLIPSHNVSTQPEWQLGWAPPNPLKASSLYWLDQATGKVYTRNDTNGTLTPVTGTP